ncbi:TetR/AcrR family transcriptional regulator [Nocardiopsis halotolerans]|uniref:TetR/AcrR family transcriptional regulator n=1 Tax=Nocardiopsis halotolerans TaxID=124252 RepID=UPI0005942450|nr:TetR family transcriptional regulator [Nocardiopsis halotolerans]
MTKRTETTRALLLNAARTEFAAYGIAGARVDRIAELAGVNKQRLYANFGDKEHLFQHVVSDALDELSQVVALDGDTDPAAYVARVFDYHRAKPELLRLLLWEALHYGEQPLPNEEKRKAPYEAKLSSLAQQLGTPLTLDTRHLLLSLIGLAAWPQITPQLARLIVGPDAHEDESQERLRDHIVEFVRSATHTAPSAPEAGTDGAA